MYFVRKYKNIQKNGIVVRFRRNPWHRRISRSSAIFEETWNQAVGEGLQEVQGMEENHEAQHYQMGVGNRSPLPRV